MDTKLNNEMPSNRTKYLKDIGRILVRNNGKKKYYDPNEVKKAHDSSVWMDGFDFLSCAMSVFTSHSVMIDIIPMQRKRVIILI